MELLTRFLESFHEPPDLDRARALLDEGLREPPASESGAFPDNIHLHHAVNAASDANWGLARAALAQALAVRSAGFPLETTDDWLHASAVLLHLNYGADLLAFLDERGDTARLRPWVEALRALHIGDRRALQNIAPEIRPTAEVLHDGIERRLQTPPASTCRKIAPRPAKPPRKA